jgi:glycosyltransferase involved in cell wall biosynthesis
LLERLPGGSSLARAIARSGASFVFASADLRDRFARLCGFSAAALPAAVEPAPFDEALFRRRTAEQQTRARERLGCDRTVILGVGRLVPVKGFHILVRALARLPPARRPRLVLLGDGPERAALRARAARAGVDLHLPGSVAPIAVADWMIAADLYVQPSVALASGRAEGMPVAVREALAVGLPVIASAVGGLLEWRDPALIRVSPADPAALARAIAAFL